jgi:hypothetical protein
VDGETNVHRTLSRTSESERAQIAVMGLQAAPSGGRTPRQTDTAGRGRPLSDIVEEWGIQSFPASDPPANW